MAEGGEKMEKSMDELGKEITCAICHDHYTEPKILPCCHYYCKDCIHKLALRTGIDQPFSCPECRLDTTLPKGGVASLKPAFFINRMKEIHSKLSRAHGKVDVMCENCPGDKAEAFCRQCALFICADCVRSHHRMKKTFAGHKTVSLEELKEGGAKDIMVEEAPLQMCPDHDEQLKIYCFDCKCLICRDCTINDHNDHNREFIKKAAPKVKKELINQLDSLEEVRASLSHAVNEIKITKSEVAAQEGTVSTKIESLFKELQQILAHRKQALLKEAVAKGKQKLGHLSRQEERLSTSCAVVQSVIDFVKQCVGHSTDSEVMSMCAEIESRIEKEIAQHKESDFYPVTEADIGVEVEDLKQLCQTKPKLKHVAEFAVVGEGIRSAVVMERAEFSVTAKLCDGRLLKRKLSLECHLKIRSKFNSSAITKCEVSVSRVKDGEYRIQYTPTFTGDYEIILIVPGFEIPGSPFPVHVGPGRLGRAVHTRHPQPLAFVYKGQ